jgi:hypothetical protein
MHVVLYVQYVYSASYSIGEMLSETFVKGRLLTDMMLTQDRTNLDRKIQICKIYFHQDFCG